MAGLRAWGCQPWLFQFPLHMLDAPLDVVTHRPCICPGGSQRCPLPPPCCLPLLDALAQCPPHASHASCPWHHALPPPRDTTVPLYSLCPWQPLTYTASILVLGESLPALHLRRSGNRQDGKESALGSRHRASRAQSTPRASHPAHTAGPHLEWGRHKRLLRVQGVGDLQDRVGFTAGHCS